MERLQRQNEHKEGGRQEYCEYGVRIGVNDLLPYDQKRS